MQDSWDDAVQTEYPLWRSYHHCVTQARRKNAERRSSSCRNLDLPDGRKFVFNAERRAKLDPAVLQHIQ